MVVRRRLCGQKGGLHADLKQNVKIVYCFITQRSVSIPFIRHGFLP
jgi:hypothetical protein